MPGVHLTYCTNIHPGEGWSEVRANVEQYVRAVGRRLDPRRAFGVGLRLSARAAEELLCEHRLEDLRALLADANLYVFTINGFAYGSFHGTPVKRGVYRPDWREDERLRYTDRLADILAALLPDDLEHGSISTVPLGHRDRITSPTESLARIVAHVAHLVALERRTGKRLVLAFEPEPGCAMETTADGVRFIRSYLHNGGAVQALASTLGCRPVQARTFLQRHVGLCVDACHAAVGFETAEQSVQIARAAGVAIAKLQLSVGLRVAPVDAQRLDDLRTFAEDVYLHQVVGRRGDEFTRWPDLPEALGDARLAGREGWDEWRIHFHVPVFHERFGRLSSTRSFLERLLALQRIEPVSTHLEVETYSWDVVPEAYRGVDVVADVARELDWVLAALER